jgi:hypothetical protein
MERSLFSEKTVIVSLLKARAVFLSLRRSFRCSALARSNASRRAFNYSTGRKENCLLIVDRPTRPWPGAKTRRRVFALLPRAKEFLSCRLALKAVLLAGRPVKPARLPDYCVSVRATHLAVGRGLSEFLIRSRRQTLLSEARCYMR